jgi:hypothetical protein
VMIAFERALQRTMETPDLSVTVKLMTIGW